MALGVQPGHPRTALALGAPLSAIVTIAAIVPIVDPPERLLHVEAVHLAELDPVDEARGVNLELGLAGIREVLGSSPDVQLRSVQAAIVVRSVQDRGVGALALERSTNVCALVDRAGEQLASQLLGPLAHDERLGAKACLGPAGQLKGLFP